MFQFIKDPLFIKFSDRTLRMNLFVDIVGVLTFNFFYQYLIFILHLSFKNWNFCIIQFSVYFQLIKDLDYLLFDKVLRIKKRINHKHFRKACFKYWYLEFPRQRFKEKKFPILRRLIQPMQSTIFQTKWKKELKRIKTTTSRKNKI
jgi:hypothetical protein